MKKIIYLLLAVAIVSCNQKDKKDEDKLDNAVTISKNDSVTSEKLPETEAKDTLQSIPEISEAIVGTYKNENTKDYLFELTISKTNNDYSYKIKTNKRQLNGKVGFEKMPDQSIGINLEGIKWSRFEGELTEDGKQKTPNLKIPVGVMCTYKDKKITFQNEGNTMNSYTVFEECTDKYVVLKK